METKDQFITVLPTDLIGGAEYFLRNLSTQWIEDEGLKGKIVFLKRRSSEAWDHLTPDVELIYGKAKKEKWSLARAMVQLSKLSGKNTKYVVSSMVHVNGFIGVLRNIGLLKTQYLVLRESNVIFDRQKGFKRMLVKLMHNFGYSQADLIICQTHYMKEQLLKGNPKAKAWNLHVMPNPLPLKELRKKGTEKLDVDWNTLGEFVVAAGRLMPLKGFEYLIQSFAQLENKQLNLVILGKGEDLEKLTKLAKALNIENRIFFLGYVENPMPYFAKAKLCVVSSTMEGFPNVLLQEMAVNDNVVSTLCAGDIDKIPGLITCKTHSAEALNQAMEEAINDQNTADRRKQFDQFLNDRTMEQFLIKMNKAIALKAKI